MRFRLDLDFAPDRCEYLTGEGVIAELGPKTARLVASASCALVTDVHVAATPLLAAAEQSLRRAGLATSTVVLQPGESMKSVDGAETLWTAFAQAHLEPDGVVVALGGGVVGDLAGFCAATWMRGVTFVQAPTTLLSMCDSAIGGKTGIDLPAGKNLVGAFHQPVLVVADLAALATLPARDRLSGFGEVVKCALLRDRGSLTRLAVSAPRLLEGAAAETVEAIRLAVETKADHVRSDVRDRSGRRALLNLGHTVGHAIEAEAGYGKVMHGEAVAAGLVVAATLAEQRELCGADLAGELRALLTALHLPASPPADLDPARLVARTRHDKKRRGAVRRMVLPHARGGAGLYEVDDAELLAVLGG